MAVKVQNDDKLRDEGERLRTFKKWPLLWPSRKDLAADGFYYLGKSDKVACAFCRIIVSDWETTDTPRGEHEKYSQSCPFINGKPVGNIEMLTNEPYEVISESETSGSVNAQNEILTCVTTPEERKTSTSPPPQPAPDDDRMREERYRLETFQNWPVPWLSPSDLAAEGFFYYGKKDFCVCAFCRGIIVDWEKGDAPHEEHKLYFPKCPFVNGKPVGNIPVE